MSFDKRLILRILIIVRSIILRSIIVRSIIVRGSDHVALIHEITRFHKIFMQSKVKPTPMPRKGKMQKPIKYADKSTSNSDSNDQTKMKTAKKTVKTEKVPDSMDTSNLSIKDYEPITDWNSPETSPDIIPTSLIDIKVDSYIQKSEDKTHLI